MEGAVSHDDAARISILKPREGWTQKETGKNAGRGANRGERKCIFAGVCCIFVLVLLTVIMGPAVRCL